MAQFNVLMTSPNGGFVESEVEADDAAVAVAMAVCAELLKIETLVRVMGLPGGSSIVGMHAALRDGDVPITVTEL